ncbi:6-phosphogluconolactonase [Sandaracinus amylolyticus]|uniref:6-phosphogluconolactonase n=1 Tax=Sandaracinus amylolyticus TaxID=927083 RepID=UPI001F007109|nr:6-phosphogluconolactonase [Sandaracinus amylolyticus]UJR79482.1 6-phosphogluconolactonase [Sandaracinus amylolyticus]
MSGWPRSVERGHPLERRVPGAPQRLVYGAAREVEIHPDREALVDAAAEHVVALARAAVAARGRFTIALAGGGTPRPVYERLAHPTFACRIDWSRARIFFGDERCVPPDHPESNYRMVREALLDRVPIDPANVHRIAGEDDPEKAARDYEQTLREQLDGSFDLVLLGMGDDGHTASLFPGSPALDEARRWVLPTESTRPHPMWRITLTPVVIDAAAAVTFLVAGASKAERLREVLEGGAGAESLPAARIRPTDGALRWMVDADAASQLRRRP